MKQELQWIFTRRPCREYTQQPIATDDLNQILEAGAYAPSGMNQQNWHFTAVRNPEVLEQIRVAVRDCFRDRFEKDPSDPLAMDAAEDYCCFYGAPCLVMVSAPRSSQNALSDGACALENIFLGAHVLGIDSCWINQQRSFCDEPKLRKILDEIGVPKDHVVVGSAALGYAVSRPDPKPRAQGVVTLVD